MLQFDFNELQLARDIWIQWRETVLTEHWTWCEYWSVFGWIRKFIRRMCWVNLCSLKHRRHCTLLFEGEVRGRTLSSLWGECKTKGDERERVWYVTDFSQYLTKQRHSDDDMLSICECEPTRAQIKTLDSVVSLEFTCSQLSLIEGFAVEVKSLLSCALNYCAGMKLTLTLFFICVAYESIDIDIVI